MRNALSFGFAEIVRGAQNTHSGDTLQKRSFLHYFSVLNSLLPLYVLNNSMFTPPPHTRLTAYKISIYCTRFRKVLTKYNSHSGRMTVRIAPNNAAFYSIKFTKSFKPNSFSIISRLARKYSEVMGNLSEGMRNVSRVIRNISDYKINQKKHKGEEKYV